MITKKKKLLIILKDSCYSYGYDPFDFIIIKIKLNNITYFEYYNFVDTPKQFIFDIFNKYNDDLINEKDNSEIISICGAYDENSLGAINDALEHNALYISDI